MPDKLYQQAILGKAREAAGAGALADADAQVTLNNPVCGDRITLDVAIADGHVSAVAHKVRGCLLCEAAASVIGERAPGASFEEISANRAAIEALIHEGNAPGDDAWAELEIFAPVTEHKSRHHCVLLPFEALTRALEEADGA